MEDIVIPLKRSFINEELRYTLRSICENMPGRKVWLVGYMPRWLPGPVEFIDLPSEDGDKYRKVLARHFATVNHPEVSNDYLLFNDDFYVMKPVGEFKNYHRGPLTDSILRLSAITGGSAYLKGLIATYKVLTEMGFKDPVDYGLHLPITYNKEKWLEAWEKQKELNPSGKIIHMRTIYGNLYNLADEQMEDVKILDPEQKPTGDETFLSSDDDSFNKGEIGRYVREKFNKPCQCEGGRNNTFALQ